MRLNLMVGSVLLAFIFIVGNILFFGYAKQGWPSYLAYLLFSINLLMLILVSYRTEFGAVHLIINAILMVVLSVALANLAQTALALMNSSSEHQALADETAGLQASNEYFKSYSNYLEHQMSAYQQNTYLISSQITELEKQKASIPVKPKEVVQYHYINETVIVDEPPVIQAPVYYYEDEEEEEEDDD